MPRAAQHRGSAGQLRHAELQHRHSQGTAGRQWAAPEPARASYGRAKSVPDPGCLGLEIAWLSSHAVNLGIRRGLVIINCNNERVSLDQLSGILCSKSSCN